MPVGATLMELRRQRGKRLSDVEQATHIMGRLLSALENGRWAELPAPAYVKGYIISYASYLGVDAAPLLAEYARDREIHEETQTVRGIPHRAVVPNRLEIHAIPRKVWIAAAVAVAVLALVIWGISALLGGDKGTTPLAPEATSTTSPVGQPFRLAVEVAAGQSSWIHVEADGLVAYDGTMTGGNGGEWTVKQDAIVRVASPAAVTVTRDGAPVTLPAAVDGVSEVTLSASPE